MLEALAARLFIALLEHPMRDFAVKTETPAFLQSVCFDAWYLDQCRSMDSEELREDNLYEHLVEKYSSRRCPYAFARWMTPAQKDEYNQLRGLIDVLIGQLERQDFIAAQQPRQNAS